MKRVFVAAGYLSILAALVAALATNVHIYEKQIDLVESEDRTRTSALSWTASQLDRSSLTLRMLILRRYNDRKSVSDAELRKAFDIFISRVDEATPQNLEYASLINSREEDHAFFEDLKKTSIRLSEQVDASDVLDDKLLADLDENLQRFSSQFRRITQESYSRNNVIFDQRKEFLLNEIRYGLYSSMFAGVLAFLVVLTTWLVYRQYRKSLQLAQLAKQSSEEKDVANAANKAKTAFLANISHELRTPVHHVMGMMELLSSTDLQINQRTYVDHAYKATKHLMSLLSDLLDTAKGDTGKIQLFKRPIKLEELLNDVEVMMASQADKKNLRFTVARETGMPQVVYADAKRLRQVFLNLIGNAIKFTSQGHVTVSVYCKLGLTDDSIIFGFEVSDSGPGMDQATQEKIFDRFYQGNTSRSRKHGGVGLGLEISKSLVELMSGSITVQSEVGIGSTFHVSVPLGVGSTSDLEPGLRQEYDLTRFMGKSVLVAEDDELSRVYMAGLLVQININSTFCVNGEEAILHAQNDKIFDLILMDLHMPKLDGFKATKNIRAEGLNKDTPIVALTADAFEETREKCMKNGMTDFMKKPLDKTALIDVLNLYIRN